MQRFKQLDRSTHRLFHAVVSKVVFDVLDGADGDAHHQEHVAGLGILAVHLASLQVRDEVIGDMLAVADDQVVVRTVLTEVNLSVEHRCLVDKR